MTVHNLSFQGQFPRELLATIGLPPHALQSTAWSTTAASAISKPDSHWPIASPPYRRPTLPKFARWRAAWDWTACCASAPAVLTGILNGIDKTVWDPVHDPYLARGFDADRLGDAANKVALQTRFGLRTHAATLMFGVISRLSAQKGVDLLLPALPSLLGNGAQLVVHRNAGDRGRPCAARSHVPRSRGQRHSKDQGLAKKIVGYIKLQIPAGKANPSPPVGPALGQRGLNIMAFVQGIQRGDAADGAGNADARGDHRLRRPHLYLHHEDAAEQLLPQEGGGHREGHHGGRQGASVGQVTTTQLPRDRGPEDEGHERQRRGGCGADAGRVGPLDGPDRGGGLSHGA